jgi:hypothetical protein
MQRETFSRQNTIDSWWEWWKAYEGVAARQMLGEDLTAATRIHILQIIPHKAALQLEDMSVSQLCGDISGTRTGPYGERMAATYN